MNYLFQHAEGESLILVLDEYPYLRETTIGLDSILQSLIDKYRDSSEMNYRGASPAVSSVPS